LTFPFFFFTLLQKKPLQHSSQTVSSNIPSISSKSTTNNNFQQTLPRYNPPPNPNHHSNNNIPTRRIPQRGRYSTGTASSLIPTPGSFIHQQTPLASPALSTASTAVSAVQDTQQKSHIPFPSRLPPQEMLKFQVRKSETEATTNGTTTTNAQLQVRSNSSFLS
jgi:hypothetical protein